MSYPARIDFASVPNTSQYPCTHEGKVLEMLGLQPGPIQDVGYVIAENTDGTVVYEDWQKVKQVTIPAKHVKKELICDCNGVEIKPGDTVYVAVKNEMKRCVMVSIFNWKHQGYGWCELGVRFRGPDGKCFSQFHPKGRLKI